MFSVVLTILKEWRMIELLKGCMWESVWVVSRWIDLVKDCVKKRGLKIAQAGRMVYDRNELQ